MEKKSIYCVYLLLVLLIGWYSDTHASNRVTIVTISGGGGMVRVGNNREPQYMTNQIIEYWKGRLDKVLKFKPDLILLPEACDSPGDLTTEEQFSYYKIRKNQVLDFFVTVAKANHCYIAFGMNREDKGKWWNSCILLDREGKVTGIYNKNFPTVHEMEMGISAGTEAPVFQCDFGRLGCTICFDLNFNELLERYATLKPDIILFPSMYHGGLEQSKWAYSCRSFFVSSLGLLTAPSEIRNPLGEIVSTSTEYYNYAVATVNLDQRLVHLDYNWEKLDALKKKYGKEVTITDPGRLGAVMITSEKEGVSANDMIKEFDIELLDDYFSRSRQNRLKQLNLK